MFRLALLLPLSLSFVILFYSIYSKYKLNYQTSWIEAIISLQTAILLTFGLSLILENQIDSLYLGIFQKSGSFYIRTNLSQSHILLSTQIVTSIILLIINFFIKLRLCVTALKSQITEITLLFIHLIVGIIVIYHTFDIFQSHNFFSRIDYIVFTRGYFIFAFSFTGILGIQFYSIFNNYLEQDENKGKTVSNMINGISSNKKLIVLMLGVSVFLLLILLSLLPSSEFPIKFPLLVGFTFWLILGVVVYEKIISQYFTKSNFLRISKLISTSLFVLILILSLINLNTDLNQMIEHTNSDSPLQLSQEVIITNWSNHSINLFLKFEIDNKLEIEINDYVFFNSIALVEYLTESSFSTRCFNISKVIYDSVVQNRSFSHFSFKYNYEEEKPITIETDLLLRSGIYVTLANWDSMDNCNLVSLPALLARL